KEAADAHAHAHPHSHSLDSIARQDPIHRGPFMSATVRTTYDEFDEMIRRGGFADAENRFELLFGEILSTRHAHRQPPPLVDRAGLCPGSWGRPRGRDPRV